MRDDSEVLDGLCDPEEGRDKPFLGRLNIMIGRTQGCLAATACVLIFGACTDPEERSDLRPSGAPEVLTVLVSNDEGGVNEPATFCKTSDNKRPGLVPAAITAGADAQICPEDLAMGAPEVEDAVPLAWYVRVQFDELLNPDIEELLPIPDSDLFEGSLAKSQPVVLSCGGVNVPYDGYYNPSGNNITWPLGPSLFIAPLDATTIPTSSDCTLMLKPDVIVDKDGEKVPAAQVGPYTFKIAPMKFVGSDPAAPRDAAKPATVAPEDPLLVTFNAQVDVGSLDVAEVTILEIVLPSATAKCTDADVIAAGIPRVAAISAADKDPTSIAISDAAAGTDLAFEPEKTYVVTFAAGAKVLQDIANGGEVTLPTPDKLTICFKTDEISPP
jgi:hypothetical protein